MMDLPRAIRVAGRDVRVEWSDEMLDWGDFDQDKMRIRISSEMRQRGDADIVAVLCHEAMHACLALSGLSFTMDPEHEEALARMTENLFLPAIWPLLTELES